MKKEIFKGKTTICGQDFDLKFYKVDDEDVKPHYEWEVNPCPVDVNQADKHHGEINKAETLEELLFRLDEFKKEIHQIKRVENNPHF